MKAFVTGGAGYIGSVLASLLIKHGHEVTVFDTFERGKREVAGATIVRANMNTYKKLFNAMLGHDIVFNLAGYVTLAGCEENRLKAYRDNFATVRSLLVCMHELGIKNLVHASTGGVYAPGRYLSEDDQTASDMSRYARTKSMAEIDILIQREVNATIFRFFNVVGCGYGFYDYVSSEHLFPMLWEASRRNETFKIFGDGSVVRDYINVKDIAEAMRLEASRLLSPPTERWSCSQRILNLGNGVGFSTISVVDGFNTQLLTKPKIKYEFVPPRNEPKELVCDPHRAIQRLGWEPKFSLIDSIREVLLEQDTAH